MLLAVPRFKHGSSPWTILTVTQYQSPSRDYNSTPRPSCLVQRAELFPWPSDDTNGVGGSHASCSWDGNTWFTSTINASYAPTSSSFTLHVGAWTYLEMKALSPGSTGQSISKHRSFHFNQLPEKPLASTHLEC